MRKYIAIFMVFILLVMVFIPTKDNTADAAAPVLVGGGVYVGGLAYVIGALGLGYGLSQLDEDMAEVVYGHAESVYNGLNDAAKSAWESVIDSINIEEGGTITVPNEVVDSLEIEYNTLPYYDSYNFNFYSGINGWPTNLSDHYEGIVGGANPGHSRLFMFPGFGDGYLYVGNILNETVEVRVSLGAIDDSRIELDRYSPMVTVYHGDHSHNIYGLNANYTFPEDSYYLEDFVNVVPFDRIVVDAVNVHLREEHTIPPFVLPRDVELNVPPMPTVQEGDQIKVRVPPLVYDGTYVRDGETDLPLLDVTNPTNAPTITDEPGTGWLDDLLGGIGEFWDTLWGWLQDIIDAIQSLGVTLQEALEALGVSLRDAINSIPAALSEILAFLNSLVDSLVTAFTNAVVGDLSNVKWRELEMTASTITYKFPFSLPWDVGRSFDAIFGDLSRSTEFPEFPINFSVMGQTVDFTLKLPDVIINWLPFVRAIVLIIFDISLIYAVRKVLGGAS